MSRPARPITIHDLLTHTSGLTISSRPAMIARSKNWPSPTRRNRFFSSRGQNGNTAIGINTLGRIIEVVSGTAYADFMRERFFEPLGMKGTTFWPSGERVAKSYKQKEGGGLEEIGIRHLKGELSDRTRTAFPMGGLFSTAYDVARFYRMLLCGGELDGRRVLSAETVARMTSVQSGNIKTGFVDGIVMVMPAARSRATGRDRCYRPAPGHGGAHAPRAGLILRGARLYLTSSVGLPNADVRRAASNRSRQTRSRRRARA